MAIAVIMPKQGQSVETCIISKWFKKKGDEVSKGEILLSYETDKAAFDLESPAGGTLLDIFYQDGEEVVVLANIAVIGNIGDETKAFNPNHAYSDATIASKASTASNAPETLEDIEALEAIVACDRKIRISPRARKLAEERGVNFSKLIGTGPNGRVITADIECYLSSSSSSSSSSTSTKPHQSAIAGFTEQPLSNVRKIIARTMHASIQNSAQLTHHMSADVRWLLDARRKIKSLIISEKDQQDITLNDMICWCVVRALEKFPEMNSHFLGDRIKTFHKIHLGLAVDTPRGLMVPVVINADEHNLSELSKALKSVAEASKKGSISPELIQSTSATFTVSNLGNYGVEMFTPVINLPQSGILGVCAIINRPADLGNNIYGFVPYIGLSLTYDHRAIDGGPATLFLREIRAQIEAFRY
jgi:pyruvate dehydrogenase E2 component (dihydrolipoamide acetyltransferase)